MYIFTKTPSDTNPYDITNVELAIPFNDVSLDNLADLFVSFAQASGFVISEGTTIVVDGNGCYIEHPEVMDTHCKCDNGCDCDQEKQWMDFGRTTDDLQGVVTTKPFKCEMPKQHEDVAEVPEDYPQDFRDQYYWNSVEGDTNG